MPAYKNLSKEELEKLKEQLTKQYEDIKAKGLNLDMSRGKPGTEQLDLSMGMIDTFVDDKNLVCETGIDCRNYGILDGIPEAKRLLSDMIECPVENIIIYGNSSLNIMYDTISRSFTHGVMGSTPWCKLDKVKFLCPVPGYDRHFAITEFFGIEMIPIPMDENGPDMDLVEKLVENDASVKGIWCVPKYSNPSGTSYSDETVIRMANLHPAADDFRLYWDNAYCIHHLYEDDQDVILEILDECEKAGNTDMVFKFCSTSKITFPGSGIAAIASSKGNIEFIKKQLAFQTIGHDKLNQLRHCRFFGDIDGIREHMKKHAEILRPRFETVINTLETELGGLEIAEWTKPKGGYFISLNTLDNCGRKVVNMCKEAGLVLTPAGATYPYGIDPHDANIRIAPTYPSADELKVACEILVLCIKIVSINKYLKKLSK